MKYYTEKEAAEAMDIKEETLSKLRRKNGDIPRYTKLKVYDNKIGRPKFKVMYSENDVNEWIDKHGVLR